MIAPEEMVVTVTHGGYVKRNAKSLYKAQRRGGRGITGAATHEEDFVAQLFVASTHDTILMLTNKGRAYTKKVWEVPQAGRTAKGKAFINLVPLQEGERVVALLPVREFSEGAFVVMVTRQGMIKKTSLNAFAAVRASGIIALGIADDDDLVSVRITEGSSDILIGTRNGWAIRFREENVRPMGRTARGVRGIRLREGDGDKDQVVGMAVVPREEPACHHNLWAFRSLLSGLCFHVMRLDPCGEPLRRPEFSDGSERDGRQWKAPFSCSLLVRREGQSR